MHRQTIIREGLRSLLERTRQYKVISEAGNSRDGHLRFRDTDIGVALVELSPEGIRLAEQLAPAVPTLFVTLQSAPLDLLLQAIEVETGGCVCLDEPEDILRGCHAVLAGKTYFTPHTSLEIMRELSGRCRSTRLTERELQILRALSDGSLLSDVASKMCLATSTVKSHLSRIYQKLGVRSRKAATAQAEALGLLSSR